MSRCVLGLDFGSSTLKAAVWDGTKVSHLVEEPMPEQLVRGGNITSAEAMAAFLKGVLKKHRIRVRHAAVILPASQVFVQVSELPAMTQEQLRLNLPYEFRDFIAENRGNYFYDYALIDTVKNEAGEVASMRLVTAAVSKELIRTYDNLCRWAGLKLVTAIPVEMAYTNLLRLGRKQAGRDQCIIDCGHRGFRIYFFRGDTFETARVGELGGASIDELLSDLLETDVHIAHVRKETNLQGELDSDAVRDRFQDIMREVQRAINFYHFSNPDRQLEIGYLCGGSSRLDYVRQQLQEITQLELHSITELLGQAPEDDTAVVCAAAIGAAAQ